MGAVAAACLAAVSSAACVRPCANGVEDGDLVTIRLSDRWRESDRFDWTRIAPPAGVPCGPVDRLEPGFELGLEIVDSDTNRRPDGDGRDCFVASAVLASAVGPPIRSTGAAAFVGNAIVATARAECTAVLCYAAWAVGIWVGDADELFLPLVDGGPAYVAVTREYSRPIGADVATWSDTWAAEVSRAE